MPKLFRLDHKGAAEILLDGPRFYPSLHSLVASIAASARAAHPDMDDDAIDEYTTDRVAVSYTVKDPRALLWQSTEGLLTRAAAAVGLEVTERHV